MVERSSWLSNLSKKFLDVNQDGIGDLKGVTAKSALFKRVRYRFYMANAHFASPNVDNGYDISDYQAIAPNLGRWLIFMS